MVARHLIAFIFLFPALFAAAQDKYEISLNLSKVRNDRVKVVVNTPPVADSIIEYVMPAVIPGSYSRKDFGRFIDDFAAYTEKGKRLKFTRSGNNVFVISNPRKAKLGRIQYYVNDTWDAEKDPAKPESDKDFNYIFQPGGTNIDAGRNYVINHYGFYGYIEGHKLIPYEITVTRPDKLHASTSLDVERQKGKDVLRARNYVYLVDNPVMYCVPDTVSFMAGQTKVTVSVFSETGVVSAHEIKEYITPLSDALARFFVEMPVDRYTFIMYFSKYGTRTPITKYGGHGALEHSYSSLYFLPELPDSSKRKSMVLSVGSHEFLHILTPLNVHSEEIANFDFRDPKMSRHLWMYEGVTEYFANLVQLKDSLITKEEFMNEIRAMMERSSHYPEVSFTEMSRNILDPKYKDMYPNVYQKGALIGFLLDIRLTELTNGSMGLRELMLKLAEKYGPSKPFRDEQLIDDIVALSHPMIREYFDSHVIGSKPLPFKEYYSKIGWNYYDITQDTILSFGKLSIVFNEKDQQFVLSEADAENVFGMKAGDVLLSVNGKVVTVENYQEVLDPLFEVEEPETVTIKFKRMSEVYASAGKPNKVLKVRTNVLFEDPAATSAQKALRKMVLGI